jgi:carbamoyl-phosphate synthase large subunit
MNIINVLVTGIGGPIAQGIMMGLAEMDNVRIIGADRRKLTSGHHFCDQTYTIPRYTDLTEYKNAILNIVKEEEIDAIFPGLPPEIDIYNDFRSEIPAVVALPASDHFKVLGNKVDTYRFLEKHSLEEFVPEYYAFSQNEELRNIMEERYSDETYVVVKPSETYGAIGAATLTDREHYLKALSQNKKKIINIDDYYDIPSYDGQDRFVMPFIEGLEYSVDIYLHNNEVVVAVPRERAGVSNGIVLEGKVIHNEKLIEAAAKISKSLISNGFMNLQFFETKDGYKLTDINPRFAGSQIMSLGAGVNFPKIFLTYNVLGKKLAIEPLWNTQMFRYRVPMFYHEPNEQPEQFYRTQVDTYNHYVTQK